MITDRKKVWAVKISSELPNNKHYKFLGEITLNDIKRMDLDLLAKTINKSVLRERRVMSDQQKEVAHTHYSSFITHNLSLIPPFITNPSSGA